MDLLDDISTREEYANWVLRKAKRGGQVWVKTRRRALIFPTDLVPLLGLLSLTFKRGAAPPSLICHRFSDS